MAGFETVDEYVAAQPSTVQELLNRLRQIGLEVVPGGVEAISYQIPTIKRDGINIVHFAAWKKHLAIYPTPEGTTRSTRHCSRTPRERAPFSSSTQTPCRTTSSPM